MRDCKARGGVLHDYDRLVRESRTRISRWRELEGVLGRLRGGASELTARARELAQWRDGELAPALAALRDNGGRG